MKVISLDIVLVLFSLFSMMACQQASTPTSTPITAVVPGSPAVTPTGVSNAPLTPTSTPLPTPTETLAPSEPMLRWSFTGAPLSDPVVDASGNVYFVSWDYPSWERALYSLTPSGEERWVFGIDQEDDYPRGLAISPDGTVYLSTGRALYALDNSGNVKWRLGVPPIDGSPAKASQPPKVSNDGTIYLDSGVYGQGKVALWAVTPDGKIKWQFVGRTNQGKETAYFGMGPLGTLYLGVRGGSLYALRPDGALIWELPPEGYYGIGGPPTIAADGTVYVPTVAPDLLLAVSPEGLVNWRSDIAPNQAAAIGADGTIYVGGGASGFTYHAQFFALTPGGEIKWTSAVPIAGTSETIVSTSAVISADGTIFFGTLGRGYQSAIYAQNKDGSRKWKYEVEAEVLGLAIRDATLYAASEDGNLYAIALDQQEVSPIPPWNRPPEASLDIEGWRVLAEKRQSGPYLQIKRSARDMLRWFLIDPAGNKRRSFGSLDEVLELPMGYGSPLAGRYTLLQEPYNAEAKERMRLDFTGAKLSLVSVRGAGSYAHLEVKNTGDLPVCVGTVYVKLEGSDDWRRFCPGQWTPLMPGRTTLISAHEYDPRRGPSWGEPGTPVDVRLTYSDIEAGGAEVVILEREATLVLFRKAQ